MIKSKETRILFSNTIMLYILGLSGYIFPLMTFPYLTRILGPEKYGILVFVNASMVYFQMLVDFGFLLSATKECSINRNNKSKLGNILFSVIQAKMILVVLGFIVIIILVFNVGSFADKKTFIFLSYIPVLLSVFITDFLFRGLEQMNIITYNSIIAKTVYTALIFVIVKKPDDYVYIPVLTAFGNIFVILSTWFIIIKKLQIKCKLTGIGKTLQVMKESSVFFLSRIASTVYGASNVFVLGFVHTSAALSQFGAANTLNSSLKCMFSPIADSIYPYMMSKKNYRLIKIVLLIALPLIIAGTIILYVFAEPIILLACGDKFTGAVPVFRAMLPMIVLTLPIYLLGFPVLGAMNMMKEANMSVIYASIFHIIGLGILLLLGKLTFIPVALLTCGSEGVVLGLRVFYIWCGRRRSINV
jgi:PST family polysaccharide transporter